MCVRSKYDDAIEIAKSKPKTKKEVREGVWNVKWKTPLMFDT